MLQNKAVSSNEAEKTLDIMSGKINDLSRAFCGLRAIGNLLEDASNDGNSDTYANDLANLMVFIAEHGVTLTYEIQDQIRSVEAHVQESQIKSVA